MDQRTGLRDQQREREREEWVQPMRATDQGSDAWRSGGIVGLILRSGKFAIVRVICDGRGRARGRGNARA
jgi:hypothetical protein